MTKVKQSDVVHPEVEGMWRAHMPQYSGMCPICGPRIAAVKEKAARVLALKKAFVQFGYTTLTTEDVAKAYDIAIVREPSAEDGIIPRLVRSQLEEAGLV